jgi:hypothetical protein
MNLDPNSVQIGLLLVQILTLIAIGIYVWKTWTMAEATRKAALASEKTLKEMGLLPIEWMIFSNF